MKSFETTVTVDGEVTEVYLPNIREMVKDRTRPSVAKICVLVPEDGSTKGRLELSFDKYDRVVKMKLVGYAIQAVTVTARQ